VDAGLAAEVKALCDLRETPEGKNLMRAFFLRTGAKKAAAARAGGEPRKIDRVAVIGGGVMGAGVAHAMLKAGISVSLVEVSSDAVDRAKQRLAGLFGEDVQGGRMTHKAADDALRKLRARADMDDLATADFIIEAVIEQLDAKCEVLKQADKLAKPDAIIASNTSSLSIRELAASTRKPSRVVGLHFFNPGPKMPRVEVIKLNDTDPTAGATAVALACKLGKTPVVVGDGPGFIVNRVLMPYLSEAMRMVGEGFSVEAIDRAIVDWGMPMGPLALIETPGRHSGRRHRVPVVVLQVDGTRWLVSPFGDTAWVRNVRAGGEVRLGRGRRLRNVELTEVPVGDRAPLLRRFRRRFGAIPFVRAAFDASGHDGVDAFAAEADRHPVFRIG
jgi:deazaflavin-dependent oxidoreductase (nitroreductase family)